MDGLISVKAGLESLEKSMTTAPCLTDYEWIVGLEGMDGRYG